MYSREDFNEIRRQPIGCGRGKKICMDWHYPQLSTPYSMTKLFMQHTTYCKTQVPRYLLFCIWRNF